MSQKQKKRESVRGTSEVPHLAVYEQQYNIAYLGKKNNNTKYLATELKILIKTQSITMIYEFWFFDTHVVFVSKVNKVNRFLFVLDFLSFYLKCAQI